ncbi:MAG: YegP family protein [Acidobacteriota bacterium]
MAAKFEMKAAQGGKFMFNLKATNGQVILTSETYDTKKSAEKGIESVRKNSANEKRFEKKEAKNGEQYFVLKAANGEPIGKSEMYKATKSVDKGIASVRKNAPEARLVDISE